MPFIIVFIFTFFSFSVFGSEEIQNLPNFTEVGCRSPLVPSKDTDYPAYLKERRKCKKKYTILHYAAADNNLSVPILSDLRQMESPFVSNDPQSSKYTQVGSSKNIDVIVEIDTRGDEGSYRFHMVPSPTPLDPIDSVSQIQSPLISKTEEKDSGSIQTFQEFLEWGISNYPSDHYVIVIGSHGSGFASGVSSSDNQSGIAYDDETHSSIKLTEMGKTLNYISQFYLHGNPIDLFISDACQMQELTVATELSLSKNKHEPSIQFILGTEVNQSSQGFPYGKMFHHLNTELDGPKDISPLDWGKFIVETSIDEFVATGTQSDDQSSFSKMTYGIVSSSEVERTLLNHLNDLFWGLSELLKLDEDDNFGLMFLDMFLEATSVVSGSDNLFQGHYDLGSFISISEDTLKQIGQRILSQEEPLTKKQTSSLTVLTRLLKKQAHSQLFFSQLYDSLRLSVPEQDMGENFIDSNGHLTRFVGLSIWLGKNPKDYKARIDEFKSSRLAKEVPDYIEFLGLYYERQERLVLKNLGIH